MSIQGKKKIGDPANAVRMTQWQTLQMQLPKSVYIIYLHRFLGHSIILKLSSQTLCLVTYSLQHVLIQVNHGWYTLHHTRFPCILFHKTNCKNPLSKSYNSHRFSNFISFPIQPIKCNTRIFLIA